MIEQRLEELRAFRKKVLVAKAKDLAELIDQYFPSDREQEEQVKLLDALKKRCSELANDIHSRNNELMEVNNHVVELQGEEISLNERIATLTKSVDELELQRLPRWIRGLLNYFYDTKLKL